jgi:hypothetical protein
MHTNLTNVVPVPAPLDIGALADADVLGFFKLLGVGGRRLTARTIEFLVVVKARGLHEKADCKTLVEFSMKHSGVCRRTAKRRAEAAALAEEFPQLIALLVRDLSLASLMLLKPHLNAGNFTELVEAVAGKTVTEVAMELARRFPQPDAAQENAPKRRSKRAPAQETIVVTASPATLISTSDAMAPPEMDACSAQLASLIKLTSYRNPTGSVDVALAIAADLARAELERAVRAATERVADRLLTLDQVLPRAGGTCAAYDPRAFCLGSNQIAAGELFGVDIVEVMHRATRLTTTPRAQTAMGQ